MTFNLIWRFWPCLLASLALLAAPAELSAQVWRWSNPVPHGNNIVDLAWNGTLAVQVCDSGQIYTGQGFYGWFPQNSGTTNDLQAVKFFGQRIVFVGANGTAGYSDDGVTFTTKTLITPDSPADWLVDLAVSSNLVVAVGDNAVIYTSLDGATWHYLGKAPNNPNGDWLLSATWGAGTFVISGEGGYLATSSNGTNWTVHTSGVTGDLTRVAWVGTTNAPGVFPYTGFWAVTGDGKAIYSTNNGVSWRPYNLGLSTNDLYAIAANAASGLVAGDSEVRLGTSATTWFRQTVPLQTPLPAPAWPYYAAAWDDTNAAYRLVGDDGMMVGGTATPTNYLWSMQYPTARDWLWQVTLANGLYVAAGDNTRIMTSGNGVDWTIEAVPLTNSLLRPATSNVFFCVGGTTNLLLAAGNRGCLAVSPNNTTTVLVTNQDGSVSTNQASTLGLLWNALAAPTTNDLAGLCTFSNYFYLAGGNGTLLRSLDGTNWTQVAVPVTSYLSGLAASTNSFVVTGDAGVILSSSDGVTWTKRVSGTANWLFRVRCLNSTYLAMGENGVLLKSTNALNWSAVPSGTTNWLNDALLISNTCYVVGNNGTVLASSNFVNWTNIHTVTSQSLYGAATQNGQLIVAGLQGTILRSQIIPDLNPINFVSYAQSSGENIFLVAGDADQQFTLDSSTNLLNWTSGPLLDLLYGSGTLIFLTPLGSNPPPAQYFRATLAPP